MIDADGEEILQHVRAHYSYTRLTLEVTLPRELPRTALRLIGTVESLKGQVAEHHAIDAWLYRLRDAIRARIVDGSLIWHPGEKCYVLSDLAAVELAAMEHAR